MPKHRHHPHHHRRASRDIRSDGLRLPELRLFSPEWWGPRYISPPGWRNRPLGEGVVRIYALYFLTALALFVVLFGCIGLMMLIGWLLGPH